MTLAKRDYTYRIYPNRAQRDYIDATLGICRFIWNVLLSERFPTPMGSIAKTYTWHPGFDNVSYQRRVTSLRHRYPWLQRASADTTEAVAKRFEGALYRYLEGRAEIPKLKRPTGKHTAYFKYRSIKITEGKLALPKITTPIKVKWSRPIPKNVTSVLISRDATGRYYAVFRGEVEIPVGCGEGEVGIDLGLTYLYTTSDGKKRKNLKPGHKEQRKLARLDRRLSKKTNGSKNHEKARKQRANLQRKIAARRNDFTHKETTELVKDHKLIVVELLNIKQMAKNRQFSKLIYDSGWGNFVKRLVYKADSNANTKVVRAHPFFPSTARCSVCGHVLEKRLTVYIRKWTCPKCGILHDRDINAAKNLLSIVKRFDRISNTGGFMAFDGMPLYDRKSS